MRLSLLTGFLFVLALFNNAARAFGQLTEKDSATFNTSVKNALSVYHQFLDNPTGLFNGGQYIVYANQLKDDHPYFQSDSMNIGTVVYDSVAYENILMFYDIVRDQVVINDPFKIYKISLISEKVNTFRLLNRDFIRLEADSINHKLISAGFYDRLYQGKITLFEKEIKKIQENIVNQELFRIVIPHNFFYIVMNGKFYEVNRKKLMLNLLRDHKREIQQFMRKNKLNYRRDKENTLVKVVRYYDGLPGAAEKKS